jgi:cytoskeletal protein CcmA (bactofilin family)
MFFGKNKDKEKDKKDVPKLPKKEDTVIGEGIVLDGEISGSDSVFISGRLKGKINLTESLTIRKSGEVEAEIKTQTLTVAGTIRGNSEVKNLSSLKSTANVSGDINTPRLVVDDGAIFNGKCIMNPEHKPKTKNTETTTTSTTRK